MALDTVIIRGRLATMQEAHEFLGYKRRLGEKVRVRVTRGARATAAIRDRGQLEIILAQLRENPSYARALERLDALFREVATQRGVAMPLPPTLKQEEDGTIGLIWPGLTIAANDDGLVSIINGAHCVGLRARLLDALAARAVHR
jgi:hypothetical protein